jgi:hypothetical protein
MDVIEKLTQLLTNKNFSHNGKEYCFLSCKKVVGNIMILTNKETIQVSVDRFNDFYEKVKNNCFDASNLPQKKEFVPSELPMQKSVVFVPEMPKTYQKLNDSFDRLIDEIDNASEKQLKFLESKAKMLTSMAQTTVNMENSRINLIKIFQGK